MNPDLSIIIPIYNTSRYLPSCLDSVVSVNINKEIILIDDGSTDNSRDIILKYKKKYPFITSFFQENKGAANARNLGLKHAKGKYIFFLDSDDYINTNNFEKLFQETLNKNIDICNFKAEFFLDNINYNKLKKSKFEIRNYFSKQIVKDGIYDFKFLKFEKRSAKLDYPLWLYFFKHDLIIQNNIYFKDLKVHEDDLFTTNVIIFAKTFQISSEILYSRRFRKNSLTTSKNYLQQSTLNLLDVIKELQRMYDTSSSSIQKEYLLRIMRLEYFRFLEVSHKSKFSLRKKKMLQIEKELNSLGVFSIPHRFDILPIRQKYPSFLKFAILLIQISIKYQTMQKSLKKAIKKFFKRNIRKPLKFLFKLCKKVLKKFIRLLNIIKETIIS